MRLLLFSLPLLAKALDLDEQCAGVDTTASSNIISYFYEYVDLLRNQVIESLNFIGCNETLYRRQIDISRIHFVRLYLAFSHANFSWAIVDSIFLQHILCKCEGLLWLLQKRLRQIRLSKVNFKFKSITVELRNSYHMSSIVFSQLSLC